MKYPSEFSQSRSTPSVWYRDHLSFWTLQHQTDHPTAASLSDYSSYDGVVLAFLIGLEGLLLRNPCSSFIIYPLFDDYRLKSQARAPAHRVILHSAHRWTITSRLTSQRCSLLEHDTSGLARPKTSASQYQIGHLLLTVKATSPTFTGDADTIVGNLGITDIPRPSWSCDIHQRSLYHCEEITRRDEISL